MVDLDLGSTVHQTRVGFFFVVVALSALNLLGLYSDVNS